MCAHTPSSPPHRPNHTSDRHCRSSCLLQPPWGASLVRPGQSGEPEGAKRADWWVTGGGTRNHEERFSRTRFRRVPGETAPGGTAPGHGHKSGSRWLCSRDRRRAGPGPPGGNVESCPCTGHLGKEEASGHKVHPSGGVLPSLLVLIPTHTSAHSILLGGKGGRGNHQGAGCRAGCYRAVSGRAADEPGSAR